MIKYYLVLRRLSQKVFLLGKHGGTLLFKKSIPFLFLCSNNVQSFVSSLSETRLNAMDFLKSLLSPILCSLGSRALLSMGLGCKGWLLLVLILSAFGIFDGTGTIMNMTGGNETINQGPHRGDAGPSIQ